MVTLESIANLIAIIYKYLSKIIAVPMRFRPTTCTEQSTSDYVIMVFLKNGRYEVPGHNHIL